MASARLRGLDRETARACELNSRAPDGPIVQCSVVSHVA